jgi:hypothetical protein
MDEEQKAAAEAVKEYSQEQRVKALEVELAALKQQLVNRGLVDPS